MKEKIEIIDNIRGIACLIVLLAHIVSFSPYWKYANGCGKIGVWCFIIMSGFLSIYPYISGIKDCKDYKFKSALMYYLKKIKTLYPAFVVALLLGMYTGLIPNFRSLVKHLLCIESIGHFWYMLVIIKFYIIFPIFVVLYRIVKENNLIYGIVVGTIAVVLGLMFPFTECPGNSNLIRWYIPVFCMGMLLALIYNTLESKITDKLVFDVTCVLFVAGILIFTPFFRELVWGIPPSRWLQNKYLLMGALWSGVILSLLFSKVFKAIIIKSKIFSWISAISYEMYLIHFTVLLRLNPVVSDMTAKAVLVIVISVVLSVVTHLSVVYLNKSINKH